MFFSNDRTSGLQYSTFLDSAKIYICKKCSIHLADDEHLISRASSSRCCCSSPRVFSLVLAS